MRLVVIDICGTLYKSNTTFDFLYWKFRDNWKYELFYMFYHLLCWRIVNKLIWKITDCDITRVIAVRFLKGISERELHEDANRFYDEFLIQRRNIEVFDLLERLRLENKSHLILLSATMDFIAKCVSRKTGIELRSATELGYDKGLCIGKISKDVLGKKYKYINHLETIDMCITDDVSDLTLVKLSEETVIIRYPWTLKKWEKALKDLDGTFKFINIVD